jgi:thiamine-monophosphate kinase
MIDPDAPLSDIGERALLAYLERRLTLVSDSVVVGVGDDAAVVATGPQTLVTTDSLVEGVHLRRDWTPPRLLGRKVVSVNLSDIAAMGGIPRHAVVSLCLRPDTCFGFIDELYDGLLERASEVGVAVVGGNVSATDGPLVIDLTLLGAGDRLLRRNGAQPGDRILVTGSLGAAAVGLRLLQHGARLADDGVLLSTGIWTEASREAVAHCLRAQLDPAPPWAFCRSLAELEVVHAAMDISDGLSGDLLTLCRASDVGARLEHALVPLDAHAARFERARGGDALNVALVGGEDYQLLMTLPEAAVGAVRELGTIWGLAISDVGAIVEASEGVSLVSAGACQELESASFDHFRSPPRGGVA